MYTQIVLSSLYWGWTWAGSGGTTVSQLSPSVIWPNIHTWIHPWALKSGPGPVRYWDPFALNMLGWAGWLGPQKFCAPLLFCKMDPHVINPTSQTPAPTSTHIWHRFNQHRFNHYPPLDGIIEVNGLVEPINPEAAMSKIRIICPTPNP